MCLFTVLAINLISSLHSTILYQSIEMSHKQLTRDQRLIRRILKDNGFSVEYISNKYGFTARRIYRALKSVRSTPDKRSGRPKKLKYDDVSHIINFVAANKENRRMSHKRIADLIAKDAYFEALPDVDEMTVTRELAICGYNRRLAHRKTPLSETNKAASLASAEVSIHWTTSGSPRQIYVTCRDDEVLDPDCIQ